MAIVTKVLVSMVSPDPTEHAQEGHTPAAFRGGLTRRGGLAKLADADAAVVRRQEVHEAAIVAARHAEQRRAATCSGPATRAGRAERARADRGA